MNHSARVTVLCWFAEGDGEVRIKRYRKSPKPHLENLQIGRWEVIPVHDDGTSPDAIFGVLTYSINDARCGEFDDCPVM